MEAFDTVPAAFDRVGLGSIADRAPRVDLARMTLCGGLLAKMIYERNKGLKMRCKQDMIDAGDRMVPRTCPVHGIQRCRPNPWTPPRPVLSDMLTDAKYAAPGSLSGKVIAEVLQNATRPGAITSGVNCATQAKVYLAGKMRGLPNFNKPMFDMGARFLREKGYFVFSPVEYTESVYGPGVFQDNPTGDESLTPIDGRVVFAADLKFICEQANIVALLPGWETSKGALAEKATAEALGHRLMFL